MRWYLVILMFIAGCAGMSAQTEVNVVDIGGAGYEDAVQIVERSDGNIYVCGTTSTTGTGNTDMYVSCLDEELNCIWSYSFGSPDTDRARCMAETDDGGVVVCGVTNVDGDYNILAGKLSASGELLWQSQWGTPDWDFPNTIAEGEPGSFWIAGETYGGVGGLDAFVTSISDSGVYGTIHVTGSSGDDSFLSSVKIAEDGSFAVSGYRASLIDSEIPQFWVRSYAYDLTLNWERIFPGTFGGKGTDIHRLANGNLFVSGFLEDDHAFSAWIEYSLQGIELSSGYDDQGFDYRPAASVHLEDSFVLAGNQSSFGNGGADWMLQLRGQGGNWLVGPSFGTGDQDVVYDAIRSSEGRLYFAGVMRGESNVQNENALIVVWPEDTLVQDFSIVSFSIDCVPQYVVSVPGQAVESAVHFRVEDGLLWIDGTQNEVVSVRCYDQLGRELFRKDGAVVPGSLPVAPIAGPILVVIMNERVQKHGWLLVGQ